MERTIELTIRGHVFPVKNICPYCHNFIEPKLETSAVSNLEHDLFRVGLLLKCPACQKFFATSYSLCNETVVPIECVATPNLNLEIPEEIEKISPKFIEIYTQALTAEFYNLTELAGIGLRKAIEFLVKDYLIFINPETSEEVKSLFLGRAIEKISNSRIKTLAKATVWLGNDETHYQRIHKTKDIKDMKKFIKALLHFISFELIADEAEDFTASSIDK